MAFIYNLTDTWNDVTTTWNGIKLAVTNTGADSSSKLLNLTVTGASTASFVVDKSGNLALNGSVNKITFTAPATGAILTLADNSTFITSGAYSSTFTFTGTTTLTFPTSGTVTALGNTTTGSGAIVLASSPSLITPALGTPSSGNLANCTAYPISALSGAGTGVLTALAVNVGSAGSFVTFNGALGTPSSGTLTNCTGYPSGSLTGLGTGVATALANNVGSAGAIVVQNGVLGTPSSGTLTNATGLPLTTGVTGTLPVANGGTGITSFGTGVATALGQNVTGSGGIVLATSPSLTTPNLGTPSAATLTNATGLPISTGVSGLGTGVATFLATPSSANLASAVTDETGSGPLVFATSPTFTSQITLGTQGTTQGSLVLANTASTYATTIKSSNSAIAPYTLTLPSNAGTNGYFLQTDGVGNLSWAAGGGGGGGSVAGSDKQVQFNDAGSFGAAPSFLFDKTTYTMTLGLASTSTGVLALGNASSANLTKIRAGNASVSVTYTLPTADGTNGQALITNGSGALSWTTIASGLTVGSTAISGGTTGRILYDNAGTLGEKTVTGTGDIVLATSPTLVTPLLGTPTSGNLSNCTNIPVNQATGTLPVVNGGTGLTSGTSGGVLYYSATGTLASSAALAASSIVLGGGAGVAPATTTTGTGVVTAIGNAVNTAGGLLAPAAALTANALVVGGGSGTGPSTVTTGTGVVTALAVNTGSAGAFVVNGGALGTPANGTLTNCTGLPISSGVSGLGSNVATFLATPSSANLAAAVTDETGSGSLVFATSPSLTTPTLGVATATSVNKITLTSPATSATITPTDGTTTTLNGGSLREALTGNRTYYVATTGSNSNTGLSAGSPFLTIQKAIDVCQTLDLRGYSVTISVAAGTYTGGISVSSPFVGGTVSVVGDTTTPANVIISTTSANCVTVTNKSVLEIGGFKLQTTTAGSGVLATTNSLLTISGKMDFGTIVTAHIYAQTSATVSITANYNVTGASLYHILADQQATISMPGVTVTLSGTQNYGGYFALMQSMCFYYGSGASFTGGTITGTRYSGVGLSLFNTAGGGANFFPGNVAGSVASGSQYI